mmetsp:Transcript_3846/g.13862  ORF Transcript_3846/g.13862 Transcript_3846/m.13862 type:complete len:98 (+) Transcript_3846:816-1109(+)
MPPRSSLRLSHLQCLVHFPTFRKIAMEVGLELVEHINLHDFFERATTKSSKKAVRHQLLSARLGLTSTAKHRPPQANESPRQAKYNLRGPMGGARLS